MHERSLKQLLFVIILAAAMTTASNAVLAGNASGEQAADGQDANKTNRSDFIDKIDGIHTVKRATVVLVPAGWALEQIINEHTAKEYGCTFTTRDLARITSLIDLLKHASVGPNLHRVFEREPREGIYLTLSNGTEVSFRFEPVYLGAGTVRGRFSRPQSSDMAVLADASLPLKLFQWAKKTGGLVAQDDGTKRDCEASLGVVRE